MPPGQEGVRAARRLQVPRGHSKKADRQMRCFHSELYFIPRGEGAAPSTCHQRKPRRARFPTPARLGAPPAWSPKPTHEKHKADALNSAPCPSTFPKLPWQGPACGHTTPLMAQSCVQTRALGQETATLAARPSGGRCQHPPQARASHNCFFTRGFLGLSLLPPRGVPALHVQEAPPETPPRRGPASPPVLGCGSCCAGTRSRAAAGRVRCLYFSLSEAPALTPLCPPGSSHQEETSFLRPRSLERAQNQGELPPAPSPATTMSPVT